MDDPKTFNEKINWLKVYFHPPILHELVDKFAVRRYISDQIGEEYLNDCYGVYSNLNELNFEKLPNQFVIKATHASRYNLIVKDKSTIDKLKTRKKIKKWLNRDYYPLTGGEWAYKGVPRRIIVEKYLEQPQMDTLTDYKVFCFNGEPTYIQVDMSRYIQNYRCFIILCGKSSHFTPSSTNITKKK